jgi:hypothetical protein
MIDTFKRFLDKINPKKDSNLGSRVARRGHGNFTPIPQSKVNKDSSNSDIDFQRLKQTINDIIMSLNDVTGVNVFKSNKVVQNNPELFKVNYYVSLANPDFSELVDELLNCKSHLESEGLKMRLVGTFDKDVKISDDKDISVKLELDFDKIGEILKDIEKITIDRFTIEVYTPLYFQHKKGF